MDVVHVPLAELTKVDYNPRKITPPQFEALKQSLRADPEFFASRPCLVNQRDGQLVIYAGNMRFEAAKALGWATVPCLIATLPLAQERERNLKDNNEYGEYVDDALAAMLYQMAQGGTSVDALGFNERELRVLMDEGRAAIEGAGPPEDDVPAPPVEAVTQPGELITLGAHRLLCGDATKKEDVQRLLAGEQADLCATDPPYLVDYTGLARPGGGKDWSDTYREVDIKNAQQFFHETFARVLEVTKLGAAIYCWHAHRLVGVIMETWKGLGILPHQQIVWVKPAAMANFAFWDWQHEPCLMGWRQGHKPNHDGMKRGARTTVWIVGLQRSGDSMETDYYSDVWEMDWEGRKRNNGGLHPTTKPVEIFARPMRVHTAQGALCYEPFAGSGSQLIAAEKLARRCVAMELEPRFCDVIRDRYAAYVGEPKWAAHPSAVEQQLAART